MQWARQMRFALPACKFEGLQLCHLFFYDLMSLLKAISLNVAKEKVKKNREKDLESLRSRKPWEAPQIVNYFTRGCYKFTTPLPPQLTCGCWEAGDDWVRVRSSEPQRRVPPCQTPEQTTQYSPDPKTLLHKGWNSPKDLQLPKWIISHITSVCPTLILL